MGPDLRVKFILSFVLLGYSAPSYFKDMDKNRVLMH